MKKLIPNETTCAVCKTQFAIKTDVYGFHSCSTCETSSEKNGDGTITITGREAGESEFDRIIGMIVSTDA
jgi:hypothetical protein